MRKIEIVHPGASNLQIVKVTFDLRTGTTTAPVVVQSIPLTEPADDMAIRKRERDAERARTRLAALVAARTGGNVATGYAIREA